MSTQTQEEKVRAVLEARANRLSAASSDKTSRTVEATVALCSVGTELIGIPVECAQEVIRTPPVSPLPGLPPWFEGITQIRGEIISVVSLAKWFGVQARGGGEYLVVLGGAKGGLGLLVDCVLDFRNIYEDELAATSCVNAERPLRAMTRDLVALLDPTKVFSSPALVLGDPSARRPAPGEQRPTRASQSEDKPA